MADFFNAVALQGATIHTPTGFLIFNEGKETKRIPESMRAQLERDGIIEKGDGASTAKAGDDGDSAASGRGKRKASGDSDAPAE